MSKRPFGKRASGSLPFKKSPINTSSDQAVSQNTPPETLDVRIESLIFGGAGIARTEQGVVFVDFAAPGDLLRVQVIEKKKDYRRAKILEILEPSPLRISAPCPVFTRCGGCDWQHIPYSEQTATKERLVRELTTRKKLEIKNFLPIMPSPKEFNYRNRIQLHIDGEGAYYHAKRSHHPVHIQNCPIAEDAINEQIPGLRAKEPKRIQLTALGQTESSAQASHAGLLLGHEFSQVNTLQNEQLVATVLDWARPLEISQFFDLYAGSGNFSFPLLAERPKLSGLGVELHPKSVNWAQEEVQRRKIKRSSLEFLCGSVDTTLPRLKVSKDSLVILDPPRDGLSEVVSKQLSKIECESIFYISCNPSTLVRDLERITQNSRWKIERLQVFDMFPQTAHIEVLAELKIDS